MRNTSVALATACFSFAALAATSAVSAGEWSGNVSLEGKYFPSEPAHAGQNENGGFALSVEPEYKHKWDDDNQQITFTPYYRWDENDDARNHGDIRQLDYLKAKGDWEFQVGLGRKFWGVTESAHLVDIINQTDGVEGSDGEDKLGQPLLRASRLLENGSVDLFVLPYFRERTFKGVEGRLRSGLVVDTDAVTYESTQKEKHVDYAVRWSHTKESMDIGVSYFDGTSRDPSFSVGIKNGNNVLIPHYPLIQQLGLDLQQTGESTIWKLEVAHRRATAENYTAAVGGFEHSLPAFESGAEIGLLGEYHFDTRGEVSTVAFQNDVFVGARLALNDEAGSELLGGVFYDLDNESTSLRVEASRRLGNGLKLNVEAQVFTNIDAADPLDAFAKDDYLQVELQKFF